MQCPKCDHQDTDAAFGDPARCPACGVFYAKALAHKQRLEAAKAPPAAVAPEPKPEPVNVEPVAVEPPPPAKPQKHLVDMTAGSYGAQPVVVVDIHMSFNSMVWFMVKWVIAAIPAAIILTVLVTVLLAFFGGLGRYI